MAKNVTIKELQLEHQRRIEALVPRKSARPELRSIPPLTVDGDEAYLVREMKEAPWKRMTRKEIEEQWPEIFEVK